MAHDPLLPVLAPSCLQANARHLELVEPVDAQPAIAQVAEDVNNQTENIGARRLHTLMECLLDDILFEAPDMRGMKVVIDGKYVGP